ILLESAFFSPPAIAGRAPSDDEASASAPALVSDDVEARDRRTAARLWPAALLAIAVSLLGWVSLAYLDPGVREVVVLPARDGDYVVVDGVADTIAAQLARRTSLTSRKGAWGAVGESAVEAGRRLRAESVLSATVDRSRDPWRIAVQLTRTRDGHRLWSWVFDVSSSAPAVATAIGVRAAAGLGRHLGAILPSPVPDTVNAEAFDLFLQAREHWRIRTPHSVQQAIALYQRAIALDPTFARAYAGLADCYNLTMSGLPTDVRYPQAKANAERALALDPALAEAHTSLAFLRYKFEWRWDDAEASFRRAIEADPSYALAHHWYGEFLGILGRYDEAIAELRLAQALEPNSLAIESDLVPPLLRAGRVAEARAVVEAAAATNPTWHWVPRRMSEVLAAEGSERESLEEHWRALVLSGATLASIEELRAAYRSGGRPAVLRLEIARLLASEASSPGTWMVATHLSSAYARLGERADALRWIGVALDRREDAAFHLLAHPDYASLRGDPDVDRMLARVGLKGREAPAAPQMAVGAAPPRQGEL
ncbi:MAG: tetratricopeptide repeat protein, partial [Vicinamibacterales bacterium]